MGHYWSEMKSQSDIEREIAEDTERHAWQDAGYKYRSGRYRNLDTLVCPHAGCVVDIKQWRGHEAFHQSLMKG